MSPAQRTPPVGSLGSCGGLPDVLGHFFSPLTDIRITMGVDGVLPPDANQSPRNSGGRAQRPVIFFQISLVDCNVKLRVRTVVPQESILVFQITFFFF